MPFKLFRSMLPELTIVTAIIMALSVYSHCTPTAHNSNSIGVVTYSENPNVYLMGSVIDGAVLNDAGRAATSVRFSPSFTYVLFDETVLFCGDVSGKFNRANGPIVLAYRRAASRMFQGIACHELLSVNKVQANP